MKNIKPVKQNDLKDCGICCMQWIIKYYNGYIPLEKLREDTYTDMSGTTAFHIINAFNKWGFDASGVLEHNIENLSHPLIAHVILKNGLEHFVVVKKVIKNTIYLMDPGIGDNKITKTMFNQIFTGHVILVRPRSEIVNLKKGITITELFLNILKKEKSLIFKIILTSFLWTLIIIICGYYLKVGSKLITDNINILKYSIFIFLVLTILKAFLLFIREYYENHLSNLVDSYIYPEFLRHMFFLPLKNVKSRSTGEIITRVEELGNIKSLFSDIFVSCFLDLFLALISILILYFINNQLFLILLGFMVVYVLVGMIISKIMYKKLLKNIDFQTEFNSEMVENLDMIESIKNLNVTPIILKRIEKKLSCYLFNNYEFSNFYNISNLIKDLIIELCIFFINSYGFWCVYKGEILIVDLFTFNIILSYFIDPVKNIISLLPKYNYIKASFSKISEFINIEEEKNIASNLNLKGDIVFDDVSYSYNSYDNVLTKVKFKLKACDHVLLDGKSGSGKSTICKIIYKENNNYFGNVYLDGYNLKDLSLDTIRSNILYVSQNERLFTGSIKENILLDRKIKENEFFNVCKICKVDEIINKKGLRYESLIEPSAKNLSGGEKQRIILARGLLKNTPIIILDEALSEVDRKLEKEIIRNIKSYYINHTIIYISHKNQTKNFNKIIDIGELNG